MVGGDDALAQLVELGTCQRAAELRLSEQKALQRGAAADLQVRQHAQLLERGNREVLAFVDEEERALTLLVDALQEGLEAPQQRRLVGAFLVDAEGGGDHAQHVVGTELGIGDLGGDVFAAVELAQQVLDDGGLSGADIAGDDDEALALAETIGQMGHRLGVSGTGEEKARIRRQLEGQSGELVEFSIHRDVRSSCEAPG
jgi:hypothetical protein